MLRLTVDSFPALIAACLFVDTPTLLLVGSDLKPSAPLLGLFAVGLVFLGCLTGALVAYIALTLLLGSALLIVTWYYILTLEEEW